MDHKAVLKPYPKAVPRYTSYPTAPQFRENVGAQLFDASLAKLNAAKPVSVYLHIPFCDRLCWFCGCHTKHTLKYAPVARYVGVLVKELLLAKERLSFRPKLGQLHLGGGSPSLLNANDLLSLRQALESVFEFHGDTEISVEIDPSDVDGSTICGLMDFGMTRASIGVQDFDPQVQAAINRPQSYEITRDVITQLREAGLGSVNIDALYGLPLQSEARLLQTIEQCISLQPDRMALFGYAHVPWLKKHQQLIRSQDLPGTMERFEHSRSASAALVSAGYKSIGIDHFAKPADSLARAQINGTLRRNFQGYTTDQHETMFGFGASSIGKFADGYVQNTVPTRQYEAEVAAGILPKNKGLMLSEDDRLRARIIEDLMCRFMVNFADLAGHSPLLTDQCLDQARSIAANDPFGLCAMDGRRFIICEDAKPFVRMIASRFDAYFSPEQFQYSKAV